MTLPIRHFVAGLPKPISPSSHAVEAEGWVFLTGQFGRDLDRPELPLPEGIAAQTKVTLANMKRVLSGLGLGLEHVVSVRVYLTQFARDYAAMNAAYAEVFAKDALPTRTCIGVTDLVRGALVEIDAIARRG
jgi:2-iminobutanoate/2-iminopropanoate deaminase